MAVPVTYRGQLRYLAVDTGSALTFLYLGEDEPEYIENAGTVQIGSETIVLPGRRLEADDETGLGIVGVLGANFFTQVPAAFDPVQGTISRHVDVSRLERAEEYTAIPFEEIEDHVLVRVLVDGQALRLLWDTGCPHLLWIGQDGRAGDEMSLAEDVEGSRFPMYVGQASLVLGNEPARTIVALRAPRFPYFEGTVAALGGDIQGLAGQSVFGFRRMLFDPQAGRILLGPAERAR